MTTSNGRLPQPDWAKIEKQPGTNKAKLDQLRRDTTAAEAELPRTANEARDLAHAAYVQATVTASAAFRQNWRPRKRRKLLDLANLSLATGQWLLAEEARLRASEADFGHTTQP